VVLRTVLLGNNVREERVLKRISDDFIYENGQTMTNYLLFYNFKTHFEVEPKGLFIM
jgi:hypothetical protein